MAKDDRGGRSGRSVPANDVGAVNEPLDPARVRALLTPLVRLLARQAARDWLDAVANDNEEPRTDRTPPRQD
ncbi:hypothetical protein [Thalassobaculum sp.]|uniref:hypothetical protein n=1 Tax=Thalassobaculum sp. TaxID=2022740 RepID=UPI0032ECE1F3